VGLNDAREQLEVCKAQSVADERRIAGVEARLAQIRALCDEWMTPQWKRGSLVENIRAVLDAGSVDATPEERALAVDFDTEFTMRNAGRPKQRMYRDDRSPSGWSSVDVTPTDIACRLEMAEALCEQYGEQLEAVGEELTRWKAEVRLTGKNREHAERLEDILEGERS
jgi:DNA repair ATPase RecN